MVKITQFQKPDSTDQEKLLEKELEFVLFYNAALEKLEQIIEIDRERGKYFADKVGIHGPHIKISR